MPKKRRGAPNLHSKTAVKMGEPLTSKGLHFLSTLAEKAGLSPSELCEAMATGRIALYSDSAEIKLGIEAAADEAAKGSALHGATTELQPNNQVAKQQDQSLSLEKDESWQKQLAEQAQLITGLQQQITQLQGQLESRVAEQASVQSSYDSLQQQSQEQAQLLTDKQQQIEQLQSRMSEQATLQSSYDSLQQQSQQQQQAIADKEQQIGQLQEQLQSRMSEQAALQSSYDSLQQQSQQQNQVIAEKEQQIGQLQSRLESQVVLQANQKSSYESVKQQSQEQATELATLRQQIAQLRSLAAVGEARLNKWQSRNASR